MQKSKRKETARRCLDILETGSYQNAQGKNIQISSLQQKALAGTMLYTPAPQADCLRLANSPI